MNGKTKDHNQNFINSIEDQKQNDILTDFLTSENLKEFSAEIKSGSLSEKKIDASGMEKKFQTPKKETRGRPNKGLTKQHRKELNKFRRDLNSQKNAESFIVEHVTGEIITDDDTEQFKELFQLTCESVLEKFKENNFELTKKHPYIWYKKLLIELKKNTPKVSYKELDKLVCIWDSLTWLLNEIGLYITFETFSLFTSVYKYQLEKMEGVNPKYTDFWKKIINERDDALKNEILYSPYNSTNKIFMAKVNGIIEKTEPKQIEVHHSIRNYDTLPMYSGENSKDQ